MPLSDEQLLELLKATRDDYETEAAWHKFLLDAYTGDGGFAGAIKQPTAGYLGWAAQAYSSVLSNTTTSTEFNSYLDRYPREDTEKFKKRIAASTYTNYCEPIADLLISTVLKRDFAVEVTPKVEAWMQDVDGRGTTWQELRSDILVPRAAILGWCPVLFDRPKVGQVADGMEGSRPAESRAEQQQVGGDRVNAIPLLPINALDWSHDENGVFVWTKLQLDYVLQEHPLEPKRELRRYMLWFADHVEIYDFVKEESDYKLSSSDEIRHDFGEVPVVAWHNKLKIEEPVRGTSMIAGPVKPVRRHFNVESEYDEHIRGQVFALLQMPTNPNQDSAKTGEIVVGTDNALTLPWDATAEFKYIAPPATVATSLNERREGLVKEIYRIARVEYTRPTGAAQSALARQYEFESTNRRIGDFAKQLARSEQESLRLIAQMLGESEQAIEGITSVAPTDFGVADLATELDNSEKVTGFNIGPTANMEVTLRVLKRTLQNLSPEMAAQIVKELEQIRDREAAAFEMDTAIDDANNEGGEGGEGDEGDEE